MYLSEFQIESNSQSTGKDPPKLLPLQHKLFRALKDKNGSHFPGLEAAGDTDVFKYLVTGLVGVNLDEIRKELPENRFTLRTTLHVARETLLALEEIHYVG